MQYNVSLSVGMKWLKICLLIIGIVSAVVFFVSGILAFMSTYFYSLMFPFFNYLNSIGITDSLRLVIGAISFVIMLISFILYFKIKIS